MLTRNLILMVMVIGSVAGIAFAQSLTPQQQQLFQQQLNADQVKMASDNSDIIRDNRDIGYAQSVIVAKQQEMADKQADMDLQNNYITQGENLMETLDNSTNSTPGNTMDTQGTLTTP